MLDKMLYDNINLSSAYHLKTNTCLLYAQVVKGLH